MAVEPDMVTDRGDRMDERWFDLEGSKCRMPGPALMEDGTKERMARMDVVRTH